MAKSDINTKAEDLSKAASLLCDEIGEWWNDLTSLVPAYRDFASDKFAKAIEAEIVSEHARLKSEFRIVPEVVVSESRVIDRLIHVSQIGEDSDG